MVKEVRVYGSFYSAALDIEEMLGDGWELDQNEVPSQIGFAFEVTYIHNGVPVAKRTRAEILADARAAKAAKKVAE